MLALVGRLSAYQLGVVKISYRHCGHRKSAGEKVTVDMTMQVGVALSGASQQCFGNRALVTPRGRVCEHDREEKVGERGSPLRVALVFDHTVKLVTIEA